MRVLGLVFVLGACGGGGSEVKSFTGTYKGQATGTRDGVAFTATWTFKVVERMRIEGTWTATDNRSGTVVMMTEEQDLTFFAEILQTVPCTQTLALGGKYRPWSHIEGNIGGQSQPGCPGFVLGNFSLDRE